LYPKVVKVSNWTPLELLVKNLDQEAVYRQALLRLAQYIQSQDAEAGDLAFDAFTATSVLAVCFNKDKEQVMADYLMFALRPQGEP
jgi:hypothetical protein